MSVVGFCSRYGGDCEEGGLGVLGIRIVRGEDDGSGFDGGVRVGLGDVGCGGGEGKGMGKSAGGREERGGRRKIER